MADPDLLAAHGERSGAEATRPCLRIRTVGQRAFGRTKRWTKNWDLISSPSY